MDGNFTVIVVQDFYWLNMMFNEGEKIVFKDGETVFKNGVRSSKYKSAKYFLIFIAIVYRNKAIS